MGESHLAALTVMSVVLPAEGDVTVVHRQQSVVGDGHAMRVAGQILQDMFRPSERCFGVDDPVLPEESAEDVTAAAARGLKLPRRRISESRPGQGVVGTVEGKRVAFGNFALMAGLAVGADELPREAKLRRPRART